MVSTCLPSDLHARVVQAARDERRSLSSYVRVVLEDRLSEPAGSEARS